MKKIILLLTFLLLMSCSNVESDKLVLGYCPTMSVYAEQLEGFNIVELESSGEVLEQLRNGRIDVGLTGRKAYSFENNYYEKLLIPGYTLIGVERKNIYCEDLKNLEVGSLEEVDYPYGNYTVFNSLEEAFENADVVLINWNDFNDHNIVTPYCLNKKILWFRSPHVYSEDKELIKNIEQQNLNTIYQSLLI